MEQAQETMRAITFSLPCNASDLRITNNFRKAAIIDPNEILVKVEAFGLNFADVVARKGQYHALPLNGKPVIPGYEVAGVIVEVGKNITERKVGERVFGFCNFGGYAEYAVLRKEACLSIPQNWSAADAAGFLVTMITSYHCLLGTGFVYPGCRVLIHSAAGGVGMSAIQIAKAYNCEIFGTCSTEQKMEILRSHGVNHPINYSTEDFEARIKEITHGEGVDIILDAIGGSFFKKDMGILRAGGRVVGLGASSFTDRSLFKLPELIGGLFSMLTMSAVDMMMGSKAFVGANLKELADHNRPLLEFELKAIMKMVEEGKLTPLPTTTMSWSEIAKAHDSLENRKTTGKLVMLID